VQSCTITITFIKILFYPQFRVISERISPRIDQSANWLVSPRRIFLTTDAD